MANVWAEGDAPAKPQVKAGWGSAVGGAGGNVTSNMGMA